jgi:hypothetical protein
MSEVDEILPLSTSPHEDIGAAFNAINAINEWDSALCDDEEKRILKEIKLMSLYIIHIGISEIYQSNFYDAEKESS